MAKTAKQALKEFISYMIEAGQSIALLEPVKALVNRTDGEADTQEMIITELYRNGRGVCCVTDGINYRTVHELAEDQCRYILQNL